MLSLVLLSVVAQSKGSAAQVLDGAWVDTQGRTATISNRRVDWQWDGVYYSSIVDQMPDGSFLGTYLAGREISVPLTGDYRTAQERVSTSSTSFGPKEKTFGNPYGEARVTVKNWVSGRAVVLTLDVTPRGSRTPRTETLFRTVSLSELSIGGKFSDKETSIELADTPGTGEHFTGSLSYLGKSFQVSGERLVGRAWIRLFDPSRKALAGSGYVVWEPSPDRAVDLRERRSEKTDQITVFVKLVDGSTAAGIHKTLKRVP